MNTNKKLWRNRKTKKELVRRLQSENPGLEVVHLNAAGIDETNSSRFVCIAFLPKSTGCTDVHSLRSTNLVSTNR